MAIFDGTDVWPGNDADGIWDVGETVNLSITLQTTGADAASVSATVSSADPDVALTDTATAWADLTVETPMAAALGKVVLAPRSRVLRNRAPRVGRPSRYRAERTRLPSLAEMSRADLLDLIRTIEGEALENTPRLLQFTIGLGAAVMVLCGLAALGLLV